MDTGANGLATVFREEVTEVVDRQVQSQSEQAQTSVISLQTPNIIIDNSEIDCNPLIAGSTVAIESVNYGSLINSEYETLSSTVISKVNQEFQRAYGYQKESVRDYKRIEGAVETSLQNFASASTVSSQRIDVNFSFVRIFSDGPCVIGNQASLRSLAYATTESVTSYLARLAEDFVEARGGDLRRPLDSELELDPDLRDNRNLSRQNRAVAATSVAVGVAVVAVVTYAVAFIVVLRKL